MATKIREWEASSNRKNGFPYEYSKKILKEMPTNEDCEFLGKESRITSHGGVFTCQNCNKLVFIDNVAENIGNTVKCECGHMYVIESEVYYEIVETTTDHYGDPRNWDYIAGFWEITKPILCETEEPYRRVITANCVPIVLKSGKHYHGEYLDTIDIGFTLSLMTDEQKEVIFHAPYNEFNSKQVVNKMKNYHEEQLRKEKERTEAEKKQKEAELAAFKADQIRRRLMPWQKFWTAIANVCTKIANIGQPE